MLKLVYVNALMHLKTDVRDWFKLIIKAETFLSFVDIFTTMQVSKYNYFS